MKAIDKFTSGNISLLTFYSYCQDLESYFMEQSLNCDYGTTEEEKTYLSTFQTWAIADQIAAQKIMKYLDSGKISYLDAAHENINRANDAVSTIASNRGVLLVKAGLTDAEIKTKVEKDMAALESLLQSSNTQSNKQTVNLWDEEVAYIVDGSPGSTVQNITPKAAENGNSKSSTPKNSTVNGTIPPAEEDLSTYNSANLQQIFNNPSAYLEEQVTVGGKIVSDRSENGIQVIVVEPTGHSNKYIFFYAEDNEQHHQNVSIGDKVIVVGVMRGSEDYQGTLQPIASLDNCTIYK